MPDFSRRSRGILDTCHPDIIAVCNELIITYDFSVLHGLRTAQEQFDRYCKGRRLEGNRWVVVDKRQIVTYMDGTNKRSYHNFTPSTAVDIAPYPIDWKNKNRFHYMAGMFMGIAYRLRIQGIIDSEFEWGGNWKRFKDLPHFQIKR